MNLSFCDLVLIRHGQTDWNAQGRILGDSDVPLNEKGEAQAHELSKRLNDLIFSAIYSSDLRRAKATAEIIAVSRGLIVVESTVLRERCMGSWEGRVIPKYRGADTHALDIRRHSTAQEYLSCRFDAGAETYLEVFSRIAPLLVELASKHPGELILLSTHAGVVHTLLYYLDFRPGFHWSVPNCGQIKIRTWSDSRIEILDARGASLKPYFCLCQAV